MVVGISGAVGFVYWQQLAVANDGEDIDALRLNLPGPRDMLETPWFCRRLGLLDSDQWLVGPWCIVERGFELCRRDVVEVAVEPAGVVPVHPAQGGQLDVLDDLPRPSAGRPVNQLGLVVSVYRLREGVVPRHQLRLSGLVISELFG
jgi:hypothetical protein